MEMTNCASPDCCSAATSVAPSYGAQDAGDLIGFLLKNFEILTENLDGNFTLDAGNRFFHVILDHLRKIELQPRKYRQALLHCFDQFVLIAITPGIFWLEIDKNLQIIETLGIGAVFRAAQLRKYRLRFAEFEQACAYISFQVFGLVQGDRCWQA